MGCAGAAVALARPLLRHQTSHQPSQCIDRRQFNVQRQAQHCLQSPRTALAAQVPDTYAESHIGSTATKPGAAAHKTAQNKIDKYSKLASTHIFYLFAIEMATELTQEICRRITTITEDTRETTFLFQRLSMALQRGNAVSFRNTMVTE